MHNKLQIVYITGSGHSGSTLMNIILGSADNCFSAGELSNIVRPSILEEYCSCKKQTHACDVWSEFYKKWMKKANISIEELKVLRYKYEGNKATFRLLYNQIFSSSNYNRYLSVTKHFFETISEVSQKGIIVDSSKNPQKMLSLRKFVNLHVVYVCRNFKGVMNAGKRSSKKDLLAGIEADVKPRGTSKLLLDWVLTNFFASLFINFQKAKKFFYNELIRNHGILSQVHPVYAKIGEKESFEIPHMLAGNSLRMKGTLTIDRKIGGHFKNLTPKQIRFANLVDKICFFWARD